MLSEKTGTYYFYGKFFKSYNLAPEPNYEDISDENLCYNAIKFNEFKNLIDCGYAEIKGKYTVKILK